VVIAFFAPGRPSPKGNHIARCPRCRVGKAGIIYLTGSRKAPFVTEDPARGGRMRAWEQAVRVASRDVAPPRPLTCPVRVDYVFHLSRPMSQAKEPSPPFLPADFDKLLRSTTDALQAKVGGYIVDDDKRIVRGSFDFVWAGPVRGTGVEITITPIGPQQGVLL
jgi:Holliday junction resolvase RusA-like endonuclease